MKVQWSWVVGAAVLATMAALMLEPMREESATVDEVVFLGAGFSYWTGHRYYLNPEHPPLAQLWSGLPLWLLHAKPPADAGRFFDEHPVYTTAATWDYHLDQLTKLFPRGLDTFYYYPVFEGADYGSQLVYGGQNNAERLVFWGRFMQALVTLATGALVLWWAGSLGGPSSGLLALSLWAFNPIALAYGHLVLTDPAASLLIALAVKLLGSFLQSPTPRTASLAGVACGTALLAKFTAVVLLPIAVALAALCWRRHRTWKDRRLWSWTLLRQLPLLAAVCWVVIASVYFPHWSPPPPLDSEQSKTLAVPNWFLLVRQALVPATYFKGLTIVFLHAARGHGSYLMGQWSDSSSWRYYPIALWLKTPLPLLAATILGLALVFRRLKQLEWPQVVPFVGALVYLACAATTSVNIGIRHLLPLFPLCAVVAGVQLVHSLRLLRFVGWILTAWLALVAVRAWPLYIQYFNEFVGGSANGQHYLLDSNFDWGQDLKRLQMFLKQHDIRRVYLDYFGRWSAVDYYKIPCTRVDAAGAHKISEGWLVVSATHLMRPDYAWLRQRQQPIARVAYTLFIYQLPQADQAPYD